MDSNGASAGQRVGIVGSESDPTSQPPGAQGSQSPWRIPSALLMWLI